MKWLEANGYDTSKLDTIPDEELARWVAASPYHGATANDIDWVAKVEMQGAIQKWVDHSISVTVNLPHDVSEALVADVYRTAWECGCKGVTVYRDGCRSGGAGGERALQEASAIDVHGFIPSLGVLRTRVPSARDGGPCGVWPHRGQDAGFGSAGATRESPYFRKSGVSREAFGHLTWFG